MRRKLKYFLTLLWFTYLIVTSILLFTKGFLLTREVQQQNSTCSVLTEIGTPLQQETYDKAHNICLKSNTKVILLIIDALRYDFTVYDDSNKSPLPYENKLPVIKSILDKHPNSSRLYKFIADPPTTTMQRLKALTTGSLPTFIDAGSNFATSEINEDNIIDQVVKNDGKVVFMGDDTWAFLYPKRFTRNYPYPSFDVWDLDTVDNGVRARLFPELNNSDWNLLIGHFLGVDHCGHRYGPNHLEMSRKLTEMNKIIEQVINIMDDNSILFVIGDHGMTITGDHGGESLDETLAAMFVYSKRPLLSLGNPKRSVKQVDLVPTLSAILGVPIPFQNLGILIHSALPNQNWQLPLLWSWGNVQQVIEYIKTYSENTKIFDKEYLDLYYKEYYSLREELLSIIIDSPEKFVMFSEKISNFLVNVRTLCEEVWIQFDAFSISNGLTFLFLSVFFIFIICDGIPLKHLPAAIEGSFVLVCVIGLSFSALMVAVLDFSDVIENFLYTSTFVTSVLSHLMFLLPIFQNWGLISMNWYARNKNYDIITYLLCRFVLVFNILGAFSNSFINEESSVLLFLLITILVLSLLNVFSYVKAAVEPNSTKRKSEESISKGLLIKLVIASLIVLGLLRASMHFWRCRVEQEWCFKSSHALIGGAPKSEASKLQWGITVLSLSALIIFAKAWLKKCGNINSGYSITEMLYKLIPSVVIVCIAGFWVLQRLAGSSARSISRTSNYLALSVYALLALSLVVLIIRPICVTVIRRSEGINVEGEHFIANVFNKLRSNFYNDDGSAPVVCCGLGTAYSATFIILGTYVGLLLALVLGDSFALSTVIMIVVGAFFLLTSSILRIKKAQTFEDLLNVPTLVVMGWILIAQYFFYASGHQPAFSNIAWESAFVGTSGLFTNHYVLGALIILNTFGSYMLTGLLLPLLIIAPFTLLLMAPSTYGKQKEFYLNAQKGELMLFEKDRLSNSALFSVACKYIAGHAIKVFTSMLAATIHCRHLMVWNVFAPKFIFEAIGLFVTLGSVLVGYLIFLRVNSQVGRLVNKLNKSN